ncbi:hypothetical protein [Jiella sp. M17.18]|uniref:hypothetical protein n=1 Tax=Jiella sp. M17.18 TaxID=3234247 RepID=UPI0034E024AF
MDGSVLVSAADELDGVRVVASEASPADCAISAWKPPSCPLVLGPRSICRLDRKGQSWMSAADTVLCGFTPSLSCGSDDTSLSLPVMLGKADAAPYELNCEPDLRGAAGSLRDEAIVRLSASAGFDGPSPCLSFCRSIP